MIGKETPGVGQYISDNVFLQMSASKAPSWKIPNAERFNEYTKINEYRGTAPLNYRRNLNELM